MWAVPPTPRTRRKIHDPHQTRLHRSMSGSGEEERPPSGSGEHALVRSLEYPCTDRLRQRRLLAYHSRYADYLVYKTMREYSTLFLHTEDLTDLVKNGHMKEALIYMSRFLDGFGDMISHEASLLQTFISLVCILNYFAHGRGICTLKYFAHGRGIVVCDIPDWFLKICREPQLVNCPYLATMVADVLFMRSDHAKDFFDWCQVLVKAAEMVSEMVSKTQELRVHLHLPRGPKHLPHLVPFCPPPSVASSCRRLKVKKKSLKQPAHALAHFYLKMKKRLPSESQEPAGSCFPESKEIRDDLLMELLDEALKAGSSLVLEKGCIPQYFNECFPVKQNLNEFKSVPGLPQSQVHQPGSKGMTNNLSSSHIPTEHAPNVSPVFLKFLASLPESQLKQLGLKGMTSNLMSSHVPPEHASRAMNESSLRTELIQKIIQRGQIQH